MNVFNLSSDNKVNKDLHTLNKASVITVPGSAWASIIFLVSGAPIPLRGLLSPMSFRRGVSRGDGLGGQGFPTLFW